MRTTAGRGRTCFLHAGTHKTGTTSIQRMLAGPDQRLKAAGVYVPRAGTLDAGGGHHNIAWQLNDDPRFDPARGTLDDLLRESAERDAPHICLSSEDFEYLHTRPERLRVLADALSALAYRTVVVLYLRPQAGYAESLYAELVKHGLGQPFDAFLDTIVASGGVCFRERWRFAFDYERLIDGFAAVFGPAQIVVRPYEADRVDVVRDFLTVIGAAPTLPASGRGGIRLNAGLPFGEVVRRLEANRAGAAADSGRDLPAPLVNGRFDPVHLRESRRITARFNPANRRIAERFGACVPCVSGADLLGDVCAAAGIDPAGFYRKRLVAAGARPQRAGPRDLRRALQRTGARLTAAGLRVPAGIEAALLFAAAAVAIIAFIYGAQSTCTALVEFALLCAMTAGAAGARIVRYAFAAHRVIADDAFFEDWLSRASVAGYSIVGLYALVNAGLDLAVPRYDPDWISAPGLILTPAATLILSMTLITKRRLTAHDPRLPEVARNGDERLVLTCSFMALLVEALHAVAPAWWLDTTIDLLVALVAAASIVACARRFPAALPGGPFRRATR